MRGQFFVIQKLKLRAFVYAAALMLLAVLFAFPVHSYAAFTFTQSGVDDFGEADNDSITIMETFNNYLYACATSANGVQIWRTNDPANISGVAASAVWTKVATGGFGDSQNNECNDFEVFNGQLYVSMRKEVDPGELWRTSNGTTWTQVGSDGFGDVNNFGIGELEFFGGRLYANTINTNAGSEVWRSDTNGNNFTLVAITDNGFGDANNTTPRSGVSFGGNLYFGSYNLVSGGEVWRSSNGTSWSQVNSDGFGSSDSSTVNDMIEFNNELYLGTTNGTTGGQLWKTATGDNPASFSQVAGLTEVDSISIQNMHVRNDLLFLTASNLAVGVKVWSTPNGSAFTLQNTPGFGDASQYDSLAVGTVNGVTVFSTADGGGDAKLYYPDLSPTVSNVTASQRNDGTGYVDISFDIDTVDGADEVEALLQFDLGGGFSDAFILESDTDTTATNGDPKVLNVNTNQVGNSSGYILTSSGSNKVSLVWHSKRNNANVIQNNSLIRVRGFSGTNSSYASSATFAVSNSDLAAPLTSASPAGGVYVNGQTVTLTCNDGLGAGCDKTYYTVDGTTPTTGSTVYTGPISIAQSAALKFFSVDFAGNQEAIKTELYTITSNGPAMRLTKTVLSTSGASAGQDILPGDVLTYFVDYQNLGLNSATGVVLTESIPAYTSFKTGSIVLNGAQLTEVKDADAADFNVTNNNRITFDLGVIPAGATGRFSFQVDVSQSARSGDTVMSETRGQYNPFNLSVSSNVVSNVIKAQGELGGVVFNDLNRNGVFDGFESGIVGATVRIFEDVNRNGVIDAGDTGVFIGTSGANGSFSVTGMSAGFYMIQVDSSTLGATFSLTTGNNPGQAVLSNSLQKFNTAHFGFARRSSIIGRVVRTVIGGPTTQPSQSQNTNQNVNGNTNTQINANTNIIPPVVSTNQNSNVNTDSNVNSSEPVSTNVNEDPDPGPVENSESFLASIWNNEPVQQIVEFGVAPLVLVAALANLASAVSVANTLIPFLQYLSQIFTEPFRFFGARKIRRWGRVYNTLTKEPIDLAIVRLFNKETNKLVESFITDSKGRYYFLAEPDTEYYLSVKRDGFVFPGQLPVDVNKRDRVYKGGEFGFAAGKENAEPGIEKGGVVTYEIPLDPEQGVTYADDSFRRPIKTAIADYQSYASLSDNEKEKENRKVSREIRRQKFAKVFSYLGPVLGLVAFVLAPSIFTGIMLVIHILLFLLMNRLAAKRVAAPWGRIFDKNSNDSLSKSIVRLFEPKFGRLLHTRVTTGDGRYGFLVGDEEYFVVPEKNGYHFEGKKLRVSPRGGIVRENIGLHKKK